MIDPQFDAYFNKDLGVITQANGDTGDSAQRNATYKNLRKFCGESSEGVLLSPFVVVPGRFRRTPDATHWGSNPNNFSRDQHSILNLALAMSGDKYMLRRSMWDLIKRLGFHQNFQKGTDDIECRWKMPDMFHPTQYSVMIRGLGWAPLYPLLYLTDLVFLGDLYFRTKKLWDYDNMLAQNLFYAVTFKPTPAATLAFWLYERTDFLTHLQKYYTNEGNNGIPPMYDLYKKAYDSVSKKVWSRPFWRHLFPIA